MYKRAGGRRWLFPAKVMKKAMRARAAADALAYFIMSMRTVFSFSAEVFSQSWVVEFVLTIGKTCPPSRKTYRHKRRKGGVQNAGASPVVVFAFALNR